MVNRSLVRKKSLFLTLGLLFPAAILTMFSYVIPLVTDRFSSAYLTYVGAKQPTVDQMLSSDITNESFYGQFITADNLIKIGAALAILGVLTFLISTPLNYGVLKWYFSAAFDRRQNIGYAFSPYASIKQIFKTYWLYLYMGFRYALWAILLFTPPVGVFTAAYLAQERSPALSFLLPLLGLLMIIGSLILFIFITNKFFLAPYLYAKSGKLSVVKAVRLSTGLMQKERGSLFLLQLSILPLQILGWLTVCAGVFFAMPYTRMCYAVFASEKIKLEYDEEQQIEFKIERID